MYVIITWEIGLFLILLILSIAFIYSVNKYKLFETQKRLDKLYTYSKYLAYTIKYATVFKNPYNIKSLLSYKKMFFMYCIQIQELYLLTD